MKTENLNDMEGTNESQDENFFKEAFANAFDQTGNNSSKKTNQNIDHSKNQNPMKEYTSVNDQVFQSENTESDHNKINERYQFELNRKYSVLDKLTSYGMYKRVQENRSKLFKVSAEYREKFYCTVLDGQLEALSEKTNAGLMMIKGHYRKEVTTYMINKMHEMSLEIKDAQFKFLEMMKAKHDHVKTLNNYPDLKKQYVGSILDEGERYMKFLDTLVMRFGSVVDEQLRKYV